MLKFVLVAAAASLLLSPAALAGAGLRIGVVEDAAIWNSPEAEMDLAKLTGYDTVRMTAQWSTGMTQVPPDQMSRIQRAAMLASVRGITPVISIYNQGGRWTPTDPSARAQFAEFAASTVRIVPWVTTFIVGNEPNSNVYWSPQFDSAGNDAAAVAYEQLLAQTYDAIKRARPSATVVGGALDSRGTHSPSEFIQDLGAAYRASGRTAPIMDVFDEHVYADNSTLPPSMPHAGAAIATGDYAKLVTLLGKAFDGTAQKGSTLPILWGEFGVESTIPAAKAGSYSGTEAAKTVDEATQARYYAEALKVAMCAPNVIGLYSFHVIDERSLSGFQSGPFYADGTPKSSFPAIRAAIAAAHAGTLARCPDKSPPDVSVQLGNGTVTATASDEIGVGRVELAVNGSVVDAKYAAPYVFSWTQPRTGRYVVEVRASDAAGNVGRASVAVGAPVRALSGAQGRVSAELPGEFTWRAPSTGPATFHAHGVLTVSRAGRRVAAARTRVRFAARRGVTYRITVRVSPKTAPLSWQS